MPQASLIDIQHLTWHYPDGTQLIFDNFSLQVHSGDFCFLVGESGAGKTTLVKFLIRQLTPPTKTIFFNKEDIARFTSNEVQGYRSRIGVVFQDFKLIDRMTVWENITYPLKLHRQDPKQEEAYLHHLMELLNLTHRKDAYPAQLSWWERQRVAIARSLVLHPKFVIADEPTWNIDDEAARVIADTFIKLHQEENTILFITHDHNLQEYIGEQTKTRQVSIDML